EEAVAQLRATAQRTMSAIVDELLEADPDAAGKRRIRPQLWPDPSFVDVGLRGDASELEGARTLEPLAHTGETEEVKFVDAIARVMRERMAEDDRIIVLGEDVHRLSGGTNGATKGLAKEFGPDRVIGTTIRDRKSVV